MLGGGDTQTLLEGKKKLNFMHLQAVGTPKLSDFPELYSASAPYQQTGETFTT